MAGNQTKSPFRSVELVLADDGIGGVRAASDVAAQRRGLRLTRSGADC